MTALARNGEEFREDLRAPGARNAQARRLLRLAQLQPLRVRAMAARTNRTWGSALNRAIGALLFPHLRGTWGRVYAGRSRHG